MERQTALGFGMTRLILPVLRYSQAVFSHQRRSHFFSIICALLALLCGSHPLRADQVEMQNGDRYAGKVLALNTNTVVLQSDVLGLVNLPREKVATISLGTVMATNVARLGAPINGKLRSPSTSTNTSPRALTTSPQITRDTNV